jgi:RimJ/RimL family protein N-acetyltransferase
MKPVIRFIELIEDWNFLTHHAGFISTLPLVSLEIARLPYRHLKFLIFARSLDDPISDPEPKMPLEIRPFTESDLKFAREINRPSEARLCARRLERGHYGFIAMNHVIAAGYAWGYSEIDTQLEQIPVKLGQGDVLFNDAFTTPAYRGHGIQTSLTLARFHFFRKLGFRRAICYIENRNLPSIAVWQRKLNSSIIGRIDFKRIGPMYHVKISN